MYIGNGEKIEIKITLINWLKRARADLCALFLLLRFRKLRSCYVRDYILRKTNAAKETFCALELLTWSYQIFAR